MAFLRESLKEGCFSRFRLWLSGFDRLCMGAKFVQLIKSSFSSLATAMSLSRACREKNHNTFLSLSCKTHLWRPKRLH